MNTYTVESPDRLSISPGDPSKQLVLIDDRYVPDMKAVYLQDDLDGSQWTMVTWRSDLRSGDKLISILKANNCTEISSRCNILSSSPEG